MSLLFIRSTETDRIAASNKSQMNRWIFLLRIILLNLIAAMAEEMQKPQKKSWLSLLLEKQSYLRIKRLMTSDHRKSRAVLGIQSVKQERVKANEKMASFSREVQERRQGIRQIDVRGCSIVQGENMKRGLLLWAQIDMNPKVRTSPAGISSPLIYIHPKTKKYRIGWRLSQAPMNTPQSFHRQVASLLICISSQ